MSRVQRPLWPALETIESNLFAPSARLIRRWLAGELAPNIAAELDHDSVARAARETFTDSDSATDWGGGDTPEPIMPEALRELIQRRTAVHAARFSPKPKAGQIVAVDEVIGPDGPLDRDLPQTLAVLLNEPTDTAEVWSGWLAAGETDYAGYQDILLEPEDEPFDPRAGMIQIWNSVHVYLPSTDAVLAELTSERFQAICSVAADFESGNGSNPNEAEPGRMILRGTQSGAMVLSGTPLGGADDPRWRYQALYKAAAAAVQTPARLAEQAAAKTASIQDFLSRLKTAWIHTAEQAGVLLNPTPSVAHPLGEQSKTMTAHYLLGDSDLRIDLQVHDEQGEFVLRMHCKLQDENSWQLRLLQSDHERDMFSLSPDQARAGEFFLDAAQAHSLIIEKTDDGSILQLPIPAILSKSK